MTESLPDPSTEQLTAAIAWSPAVALIGERLERASSTSTDHRERATAWRKAAVHSILNSVSPKMVCRGWSDMADALLTRAFDATIGQGAALFALGKLGCHELNLSSDVDIVLVARDAESVSPTALREFQKRLATAGSDGFLLRLDFDLRPGGRQGPMIPTIDQFVDYYGNYGETWERLAFVRFRPICGDAHVIDEALKFSARFSFRKHLDFGLMDDLRGLREKIHAEHWRKSGDGVIDLKLGVGGIRDVELFVHALQVIHGGKDLSLRRRETDDAAECLKTKGILPAADADFLVFHYWRLRRLENYVQARHDEQTHRLKLEGPHPDWVVSELVGLDRDLARCDALVATLIGSVPPPPTRIELEAAASIENLREELDALLSISVLSRNKEKTEDMRRTFLKAFFETLHEQEGDAAMAVEQLKDFLKATRAKSAFFDLLVRERALLREITWIFGHSRYLGRILCYRPELLDAFVFRAQEQKSQDFDQMLEFFAEKRLLCEVIEGSRFLRDLKLSQASAVLTTTADDIVLELQEHLERERQVNVEVLCLGKWGAREMGFRSDLDFVFVIDGEAGENEMRFARRMIARLTESHRGGSIYSIDMRLRPSGKAGPLVLDRDQLQTYLGETAEAWERQAYLRARWLRRPLFDIREALFRRPLSDADLVELERIRAGLVKEGTDLKYAEGGLVDLELFAQTLILQQGRVAASGSVFQALEELGLPELAASYDRLRQIEQIWQLLSAESIVRLQENQQQLHQLNVLLKIPPGDSPSEHLRQLLEANRATLTRLDPRRMSR